jgi:anti-sigma factor RsiW
MKASLCQSLDDYLDHDLVPAERARFVAHLSECPSCKQAVEENQQLENMLVEAIGLEPVPRNLVAQVKDRLRLRRRRRWVAAAAALAATAATVFLVVRNLPLTPQSELPAAKVSSERPVVVAAPARDPVRIIFPADANVLVVREKSDSPNVTIVRVYAGLRSSPTRAQTREAEPSIPERSEQ